MKDSDVKVCGINCHDFFKFILVAAASSLLTYYLIPEKTRVVTISEYHDSETGELIKPVPCTKDAGPNQCRIYKEEFSLQETFLTTISKKKGSTTCCMTISGGTTSGGEATSTSNTELCSTTKKNLASCPPGTYKK
ncbi:MULTISPECIES: hypothetical protein [Methylomonas]|uniref:hypothetical protein n=1 Tax=Methylomonas TaxID=416 RepID=UPI0012F67321|nr:hypothetical protein [Methylomonas koyamae]